MCVSMCACSMRVCYGAFCSVVVLGLAGESRLGIYCSTCQPNIGNVLPVLTHIFSNTLHSFLTCTATSAQTTLLHAPSYRCCSARCSQMFYRFFRVLGVFDISYSIFFNRIYVLNALQGKINDVRLQCDLLPEATETFKCRGKVVKDT